MARIGKIATTTAPCAHCATPMTVQLDWLTHAGGPYCSPYCRNQARYARKDRNCPPCEACGEPATAGLNYGLRLCRICHSIAYRSCWRKRRWPTDPGAFVTADGWPMEGYACDLCPHWHTTTRKDVPVNPEYAERKQRLGQHLASIGFDVEAVRGWANRRGEDP